ncbi:MAG: lycopene cyclase domain-containing protein [Candidatus Niyogibacteria bacterium]|nr:lycopene cyclase domain-containing protein [Candidatus Niyogibacteria bacterium]
MSQYVLFQLIFFAFPLSILLLAVKEKIKIFRYKRTLFWMFAVVYTAGLFWDWLSVRTGVWTYAVGDKIGVWLWGLPVEEFIGFYLLGPMLIISVIAVIFHMTGGIEDVR